MPTHKLWEPSDSFIENSHLQIYKKWLKQNHNLEFSTYQDLWQWSITEVEDFWESIWNYFNVISHSSYTDVLSSYNMPKCKWFEGSKISYAEHLFRKAKDEETAIVFGNESEHIVEVSWLQLKTKVASLATYLKSIGVTKGDRVVAFLPNIPEATIAFLAVNSIGAIWSSTSPDFGAESVVDRFAQIKPKVLIAVDGYQYNSKPYNKSDVVNNIVEALPTLKKVLILPYLNIDALNHFPENYINIESIFKNYKGELTFEPVDFNHPIWVLYS